MTNINSRKIKGVKSLEISAIPRSITTLRAQADRISNLCGTVGSTLVASAIDNNGHVVIDLERLILATDTSDAVDAITDNFILIYKQTQTPLLHFLLREYRKMDK